MEKTIEDFLDEIEATTKEPIKEEIDRLLKALKHQYLQDKIINCLKVVGKSWHSRTPLNISSLTQEILEISDKLEESLAGELENIFLSKLVFLAAIRTEETKRIKERRKAANQNIGNPYNDAVGLALSGGGVRSSTFNLGLLQALERYGILPKIDYLSTVSGGGYIGSSMIWLSENNDGDFPFGTERKDNAGKSGKILAWIREHGNYLTPGNGLRLWSMIGATIGAILTNLIIFLPWIFLAMWLLSKPSSIDFDQLYKFGLAALVLFTIGVILFAILTFFQALRTFQFYRYSRIIGGLVLMVGIALIIVGTIPDVYKSLLNEVIPSILSSITISLSGILSFLVGLRGINSTNETKGMRSLLLSLGLTLILYGLLLLIYHIVYNVDIVKDENFYLFLIPILLSLIVAGFSSINYVSLHRFYRNRLMEAYMPWNILGLKTESADKYLLCDIKPSRFPYQIINSTVNMVGSKNTKYRERGGDCFIFSPLFCGSSATGYAKTNEYVNGNMNLATAFAISGAAVDPNTYVTRSKPITFLMTLLNIRLGYWIANPRLPKNRGRMKFRYYYYMYMFNEMFGKGLGENYDDIHLSDGGQFENLGLYELVRRKCKTIIVSDASSDPTLSFGGLAHALMLIRVDFGAKVEIDTRPLRPKENRISDKAFVKGKIIYQDGTEAELIYINTVMTNDLPEDLYSYHRTNPKFPDQTTLDQFFDETQFEAYRELGFQIGKRLHEHSEIMLSKKNIK
ncbi:MAG: hypothetical protein PHO65_01350 [Sulfurovum sp.]|nr:hypothetical protein [Sulfurovum sp.]